MDPKFLFFSLFTSILFLPSTPTGFTNKKLNTIQHDFVNFPTTTPVPNPVTTPPTVVTVPSATPVTVTPTPPSTPVTVPPTTPTTNNPGGQPVTNPVTTPPAATNAPAVPGQSWCVAKTGVPEKSLQAALDYACGIGKADCSGIQQGASCYNPNTLQNHASFAFNSYYQRNPVPTSCDFGGSAMVTTTNPSSGSCIFPTSSSSSTPTTASPTTPTPNTSVPTPATPISTPATQISTPATPIPTPTTASSTGAAPTGSSGVPPTILNASNPALGGATTTGFGDSPPAVNMTSSVSVSSRLQPFITSFVVVTSIITGGIIFDI